MNFKKQLVKFNDSLLPENFVALAVKIDDNKEADHAAILIRHKNVNHLHHHSLSDAILQEDFETNKWYIYKILDIIETDDESEVGAFLQHCKRVRHKSDMTYSFVTDGSGFDASTGEFQSKVGLPELGTCVSFCLNTITGAFSEIDSYLNLDDWDTSSVTEEHPLYNLANQLTFHRYPQLEYSLVYNAHRKRVSPLEYLCSAFFYDYPIRKAQIDSIAGDVNNAVAKKLINA